MILIRFTLLLYSVADRHATCRSYCPATSESSFVQLVPTTTDSYSTQTRILLTRTPQISSTTPLTCNTVERVSSSRGFAAASSRSQKRARGGGRAKRALNVPWVELWHVKTSCSWSWDLSQRGERHKALYMTNGSAPVAHSFAAARLRRDEFCEREQTPAHLHRLKLSLYVGQGILRVCSCPPSDLSRRLSPSQPRSHVARMDGRERVGMQSRVELTSPKLGSRAIRSL